MLAMARTALRPAQIMAALAAASLLSGCGIPAARQSSAPPATARPAPGLPTLPQPSADTRICLSELATARVRFTPLPDQNFGGGCHAFGSVRLQDIGVPTTNLGPLTCQLARTFVGWANYAVKPAARQVYGVDVERIETFGTYSCRNVNGAASGRLSQHAFANAIDISGFVLADGRRVTVLTGWRGDERDQRFLKLIHDSACRRFGTVLSPDYNAQHANHFHFDMSGQNFCR